MIGIGHVLDIVVIALLAATLLYALRLQRSLAALRQDRGALERAALGFDDGARTVEAGLARLRQAADQLNEQLGRAGALRDDLAYLTDRGEGLADRLDTLVRQGRPLAAAPEPVAAPAPAPRSRAERELAQALQGRR
jgi:ABC-type transporter Mla subunit MlaD